ncbi:MULTISPECIES: hypothetical protein [Pontibacter]|uniref:Uncharacterized protein n=1 Tax=Pontibacter lucknowensis TaxID=1077936 RepID=A0A1N6TDY3_9BACT|nr:MULTISPECIES: hypothetical protein [Pontibacter]EJF10761.1 hypothetical protein O71_07319 [Pontibacter sp. BAB1700]SIQ51464.1 hypothetical protein SAMN05421545_0266 [Pontibacter lucknowensis]
MSSKSIKYLLLAISAVLVIFFIYDSFSQPSVDDLKGDFKEVAFYRNENNTGPIVRIYAVTVADTLWQEMEQYGNYMPHTKYGTTRVYFFLNSQPAPDQVQPGQQNFDPQFAPYTLARYEKDAMGQVSFMRHPFSR